MNKYLFLSLILVSIIILNACEQKTPLDVVTQRDKEPQVTIECTRDNDCQPGFCPDGTKYKKYVCSSSQECISIDYIRDPCQTTIKTETNVIAYLMGDKFQAGGEILTVKSISQDGEVILNTNGRDIIIKGTGSATKIANEEIIISKLNLNVDSTKRSIVIKVEPIQLNTNEYVLDYQEEVIVQEKKVKLADVDDDDLKSIFISISKGPNQESKRINKGKTETILGLKITNIRSNARPISFEKYAIIKIES